MVKEPLNLLILRIDLELDSLVQLIIHHVKVGYLLFLIILTVFVVFSIAHAINRHFTEDHLVSRDSSGFVGQDVGDLAELLSQ